MKCLELIILTGWLILIFVYQFHDLTNSTFKNSNPIGLLPYFHLFSPRPFLGTYVFKYQVYDDNARYWDEWIYIKSSDILSANRKVTKVVNNLCKFLPPAGEVNINYKLLLARIKADALSKSYKGRIRFYIYLRHYGNEKLILRSKRHAL
jgi:hypothetical protein